MHGRKDTTKIEKILDAFYENEKNEAKSIISILQSTEDFNDERLVTIKSLVNAAHIILKKKDERMISLKKKVYDIITIALDRIEGLAEKKLIAEHAALDYEDFFYKNSSDFTKKLYKESEDLFWGHEWFFDAVSGLECSLEKGQRKAIFFKYDSVAYVSKMLFEKTQDETFEKEWYDARINSLSFGKCENFSEKKVLLQSIEDLCFLKKRRYVMNKDETECQNIKKFILSSKEMYEKELNEDEKILFYKALKSVEDVVDTGGKAEVTDVPEKSDESKKDEVMRNQEIIQEEKSEINKKETVIPETAIPFEVLEKRISGLEVITTHPLILTLCSEEKVSRQIQEVCDSKRKFWKIVEDAYVEDTKGNRYGNFIFEDATFAVLKNELIQIHERNYGKGNVFFEGSGTSTKMIGGLYVYNVGADEEMGTCIDTFSIQMKRMMDD